MAKDKQGNDLANVGVPVTGAICIVPYAEDNVITRTMIGKKNATPKLPEVYARGTSCLGLLTSDGAPQDSTESGDAIEFWQQGYTLNGETTISTAFTIAEDTDLAREFCFGEKPDADGVIAVDTFTPDTKWMAYEEITYKNGNVDRRAGVIQVTANEPGQAERGSVLGRAVTVKWVRDDLYEGKAYIEAHCTPADVTVAAAASATTGTKNS